MQRCSVKDNFDTVDVLSQEERIDALNYVNEIVKEMKEYQELPDEIEIINISLFGSRISGGCREDSDLDVKIEYRNTGEVYWKESHIFNIFCECGLKYGDINLDFFPVLLN